MSTSEIGDYGLWLIAVITTISTVVLILDASGFLPYGIARWINKNRLTFSMMLLRELGIVAKTQEPVDHYARSYKDVVRNVMDRARVQGPVAVGKIDDTFFDNFIDVIGATVNEANATRLARALTSHLIQNRILVSRYNEWQFDAVVCPKNGSPILAYEFSKLVQKPLALHNSETKFTKADGTPAGLSAKLDLASRELAATTKFLVVDDSTTGGRKIMALIDDVRAFGFEVTDCLVLFEPVGKGARERLLQRGVKLHAITEGPQAHAHG